MIVGIFTGIRIVNNRVFSISAQKPMVSDNPRILSHMVLQLINAAL
jgi:hypothetical protein